MVGSQKQSEQHNNADSKDAATSSFSSKLRKVWGRVTGNSSGYKADDDVPRMQISAIAAKIGLPEERVAQIAQMIKKDGLADAQMAPMMQMALSKGVTPAEILTMLTSLGVAKSQVVRVMNGQGVLDDEEAQRLLEEERRLEEKRAQAEAENRRKRYLKKAGIIVFWLVIWELLDRIVNNRLVLAGPIRTLEALGEQIVQPISGLFAVDHLDALRLDSYFRLSWAFY